MALGKFTEQMEELTENGVFIICIEEVLGYPCSMIDYDTEEAYSGAPAT